MQNAEKRKNDTICRTDIYREEEKKKVKAREASIDYFKRKWGMYQQKVPEPVSPTDEYTIGRDC